ncbi:MAG: aldehyde dehydrogenase family protein [Bacteroidetes bacterium]|mgnify:CR=1 FL=1|nr:MAG: aldehyde dehydrogenase family protein [Bacteroidota bacterium]REK36367.1 MAG: aldehyde dehydrogenase family protein [Bacteroidota bacterium]
MDQIEKQKVKELNGKGANGESSKEGRLNVMKTYKIYIDGKFPRTESGRYYILKDKDGNTIANICQGSRKDFRDAVVAARKAQHSWASRSAYNRGQILYRIAEMLEGRRAQFVAELMQQGSTSVDAESEVSAAVDRFVYYAGWCDKYQQVFSSVNPVESSHFNFSLPEATGVVSILADEETSLIGLATAIAPAIAGGNTVVTLASSSKPLCAVTFAEVLNSSDVPGGVVNIITGYRKELITHFSNHMDVNACIYFGEDKDQIKTMKENASLNVKRPLVYSGDDLLSDSHQNPYRIMDLQEIKTTWHPIGQ